MENCFCGNKLLILIGVASLIYFLKTYIRRAKFTKTTRIDGKIVIITGANTGIGKETAIDLAKRGGKIYIACRDEKRGEDALKEIKERSDSDKVHFMQLDLASLESVRKFSQRFHERENQLHILINNAGVMACPRMETKDGFELQIGTNHLGHFLLTHLLLDLLKSVSSSRIINVSSAAHKFGGVSKKDFMSQKNYNRWFAYGQSKLANILFTRELAKRLKDYPNLTVNSCHPGAVNTELQRHMNKFLWEYTLLPILGIFFKTPYEGAQTQIKLAVDPDLEGVTGKYFVDCKEAKTSKAAQNDDDAEWLYKKSIELVGL
ncbi:hypothetical protein PVAND_006776 [Polypedilum vanderplanki]|uniref:Uncharacterized protein n=1 Tax=Polypedilum vanderplanki TaxID=319348 RepID=A0A9J6C4A9_POLVA|nr:hypothetical protein PVAND_006776 [Polypedilum vanderplanki]